MKPKYVLVLVLLVIGGTLFLTGGASSASKQQPYRCFAEVNLHDLIVSAGLPQPQPDGWGTITGEAASGNGVFDGEQEVRSLAVDHPGPWVGRLCDRLRTQLARRCDVTEFSPGIEHCAAFVHAPDSAVTGPGGVYKLRPVSGRLNLFTSRTKVGKTNVVLTTTEW